MKFACLILAHPVNPYPITDEPHNYFSLAGSEEIQNRWSSPIQLQNNSSGSREELLTAKKCFLSFFLCGPQNMTQQFCNKNPRVITRLKSWSSCKQKQLLEISVMAYTWNIYHIDHFVQKQNSSWRQCVIVHGELPGCFDDLIIQFNHLIQFNSISFNLIIWWMVWYAMFIDTSQIIRIKEILKSGLKSILYSIFLPQLNK